MPFSQQLWSSQLWSYWSFLSPRLFHCWLCFISKTTEKRNSTIWLKSQLFLFILLGPMMVDQSEIEDRLNRFAGFLQNFEPVFQPLIQIPKGISIWDTHISIQSLQAPFKIRKGLVFSIWCRFNCTRSQYNMMYTIFYSIMYSWKIKYQLKCKMSYD